MMVLRDIGDVGSQLCHLQQGVDRVCSSPRLRRCRLSAVVRSLAFISDGETSFFLKHACSTFLCEGFNPSTKDGSERRSAATEN
mmetsp:Transcript_8374/g.25983  ORF Transcript_8374/g.25983 Transcript_8374/m.25983 type:complete len:84 (-) Transcript_8374:1184-1435(-)